MSYSDAYAQGFCKAASDADVDPAILVKIAKEKGFFQSFINAYNGMNPYARRAILAGLLSGAGTYMFSDGTAGERLQKGILGGLVGGAGMYGLDRTGLSDAGIDLARKGLDKLRVNPKSIFSI